MPFPIFLGTQLMPYFFYLLICLNITNIDQPHDGGKNAFQYQHRHNQFSYHFRIGCFAFHSEQSQTRLEFKRQEACGNDLCFDGDRDEVMLIFDLGYLQDILLI